MACRDLEKSRRGAPKIDQDTASISHVELNLAKLQSVQNCAENLKEITKMAKIDTVVNNAGVFATGSDQRMETEDGFELHFGTNFLGHYHLINELLKQDLIEKSSSRIVNVSSALYKKSNLPELLSDSTNMHLMLNSGYSAGLAYANSKHAGLIHMRALHELGLNVYSASPGMCYTDLARFATGSSLKSLGWWAMGKIMLRTPEQGMLSILHLIETEISKLESGAYYSNGSFKLQPLKSEQLKFDAGLVQKLCQRS